CGAVHTHIGGFRAFGTHVQTSIGYVVHVAQLVFCCRLAVHDVVRIERTVGQTTDSARVTADVDRVGTSVTNGDLVALYRRRVCTVADGHLACTHHGARVVRGRITDCHAVVVDDR